MGWNKTIILRRKCPYCNDVSDYRIKVDHTGKLMNDPGKTIARVMCENGHKFGFDITKSPQLIDGHRTGFKLTEDTVQ